MKIKKLLLLLILFLQAFTVCGAIGFTNDNTVPTYHYYTQDHLGNNRAVVNDNGTVEQITHYYPFGGTYADVGLNSSLQPYKYNGKELDRMHGLNWYEYGHRQYDPIVPMFTQTDPMAEKYYNVSPYVYCLGNPVKYVDLDGKKVYVFVTKLPSPSSVIRDSGATHTFTVVKTNDGQIYRFAYGPAVDGFAHSISGTTPITERNYSQDRIAVDNYFTTGMDENIKEVIPVNVPKKMSESQFDNAVINSAKEFHGNKTIKYRIVPLRESEGNCNSSTTSLLKNAGVDDKEIDRIGTNISGISIGFGSVKPWTEEQRKTAESYWDEKRKMDESLSNHIGF